MEVDLLICIITITFGGWRGGAFTLGSIGLCWYNLGGGGGGCFLGGLIFYCVGISGRWGFRVGDFYRVLFCQEENVMIEKDSIQERFITVSFVSNDPRP
jgi:hypothetical protein